MQKRGQIVPDLAPVMTVDEIATYLKCHPGSIYRLLKLGEIPAFRLGGSWRFRRDTIDKWIEERTNPLASKAHKMER